MIALRCPAELVKELDRLVQLVKELDRLVQAEKAKTKTGRRRVAAISRNALIVRCIEYALADEAKASQARAAGAKPRAPAK